MRSSGQRPILEGLVCVLCCMECCPSFKMVSGKGRPRLVNARRQQRVLYFYFLDPDLGLIHIRSDDLVPVHRPGLCQWPLLAGPADAQANGWGSTCKTTPSRPWTTPEAAQELADSFADLNWTKILDRLARRSIP